MVEFILKFDILYTVDLIFTGGNSNDDRYKYIGFHF